MTPELPNPIGDEVESQLARLREQGGLDDSDVWTAEDQAKLELELASIEPNPLYVNEDFPDVEIARNGTRVTIHDTNNFSMILSSIDDLRHGREPDDPFSRMFAHLAPERRYVEIFEALEAGYPASYKRIKLLEAARRAGKQKEITDEERYLKSQIYTAAADTARQLDPQYNLAFLTRT